MTKGIVLPTAFMGLLAVAGVGHADECRDNYKKSGNFLQGRTFTTHYASPESSSAAYKRLYLQATKRGMKIVNADKDMGVITAERSTERTSDAVPTAIVYNYMVEAQGKGSTISITMKSPADVQVREEALLTVLCTGAPGA